jgi:hypothetical protein
MKRGNWKMPLCKRAVCPFDWESPDEHCRKLLAMEFMVKPAGQDESSQLCGHIVSCMRPVIRRWIHHFFWNKKSSIKT